jgi:hypothetical protein
VSEDANSFIQHTETVLGMARRLVPTGVAIYKHEHLTLTFGSWLVVAGTRHRRLQFSWDGRDGAFVISRSTAGDSREPLGWQHVRTIHLRCEDAMAEMERVLRETFASAANA